MFPPVWFKIFDFRLTHSVFNGMFLSKPTMLWTWKWFAGLCATRSSPNISLASRSLNFSSPLTMENGRQFLLKEVHKKMIFIWALFFFANFSSVINTVYTFLVPWCCEQKNILGYFLYLFCMPRCSIITWLLWYLINSMNSGL